MDAKTKMGPNKTGLKTSPMDRRRLQEDAENLGAPGGNGERIDATRVDYAVEAEPLGTVAPPGILKGGAQSAVEKLGGKRPEVLVDKLGERLAFERSSTRMYDALLAKLKSDLAAAPGVGLDKVFEFREEEAEHFNLVADALQKLGADPTAQTPGADVIAVASSGLLQAVADPRTTVPQALEAVLTAELADHAGWEMLIDLAREFGQDEMADDFTGALLEEKEHLDHVKRWLQEAVRRDAT